MGVMAKGVDPMSGFEKENGVRGEVRAKGCESKGERGSGVESAKVRYRRKGGGTLWLATPRCAVVASSPMRPKCGKTQATGWTNK